MNNKSVSDYVANTMNAVLNSAEHKSLFNKYAQDVNEAKDKVEPSSCCGDKEFADDNEADDNSAKDSSEKSSEKSCEKSCDKDSNSVKDEDLYDVSCAYDVAIDSLITASAALDSLGMEKSSSLSLKLASFIVEAKKTDAKDVAAKAKEKAAKEKEKAKMKADKEKAAKKAKEEKERAAKKAKEEKERASKKPGSSGSTPHSSSSLKKK